MLTKKFCKTNYLYTPLFCEENIWQLIHSLSTRDIPINHLWCLFITNSSQKIPLLNQLAAPIQQPVIWDYHVILLTQIQKKFFIFDFDTRLGFITPLEIYLKSTFIFAQQEARTKSHHLPEEFIPYIRKIPAKLYLQSFYSDRSHMLGHISELEYPAWPIINKGKVNCIPLAAHLKIKLNLYDNKRLITVDSLSHVLQKLTTD